MRAELTNQELQTFCEQLHLIIHSGISVLEGISVMRSSAGTSEAKEILNGIYRRMEETGSLTKALQGAEVFPPYMLHMIELGEQAGKLDDVLASLTIYYEREDNIARSIKHAVTYPVIMLIIMLAVMVVMAVKVIPVFTRIFEQFGISVNEFSEGVIRFGTMMSRYSFVLVIILAVIAFLSLYFAFTKPGRTQIKAISRKFGPMRRISEKIACARFAEGMSMALSAGLNVNKSLELVAALVEDDVMRARIEKCRKLSAEGKSISDAMTEAEVFPGLQGQMIAIGFRTGSADEVMEHAAARYENEVDEGIQNILSILEPTLVAILSVLIGIILLAVMLPLAGIVSSIG